MLPERLASQSAMERSLRDFAEYLRTDRPGGANAIMNPQFVSCDLEAKSLRFAFDMQPWASNQMGIVHGGVSATMLDITMGSLAFFFAGERLPSTVTMQTSYLRPVPLGARVVVEAVCDSAGRTFSHLHARAFAEGREEKTLLTATGSYFSGGQVS